MKWGLFQVTGRIAWCSPGSVGLAEQLQVKWRLRHYLLWVPNSALSFSLTISIF